MSVRGEFRRILADAVAALRRGGSRCVGLAEELEPLRDQADADLSAAAERALGVLARLDGAAPRCEGEPEGPGEVVEDLETVCCIILGRS